MKQCQIFGINIEDNAGNVNLPEDKSDYLL